MVQVISENTVRGNTKVKFLDGAMGTMLQTYGLPIGQSSDSWNLTHPSEVLKIHEAYVQAGSKIIYTNTFGASRLRLKDQNLDSKLVEINQAGVRLARKASKGKVLIAGCMGSVGSLNFPIKKLSDEEIKNHFFEQMHILVQEKADLIVVETLTNLREVRLAYESYKKMDYGSMPQGSQDLRATGLPRNGMTISVTVNQNGMLPSGEDPLELIKLIPPTIILGINCSFGPESIWPVFLKLKKNDTHKIAIKPNTLPLAPSPRSHKEGPFAWGRGDFMYWGKKFIDAGADYFGGCCGTTPDDISSLLQII